MNQTSGRLFLVRPHNTSDVGPTKPGKDFADLDEVSFPPDSLDKDKPELVKPIIKKVAGRQFYCNDQQRNMDATAGIYVQPNGVMRLYAAYHWMSESIIKFNEYRPVPDAQQLEISDIKKAWIDLYEHSHFRGRCMSLVGKQYANFRNYGRLSVHGSSFNDKVSSARFQIPPGFTYRLYEHRNYKGQPFDLKGTGRIVEINDFKQFPENGRKINFGDKVSSSRYILNVLDSDQYYFSFVAIDIAATARGGAPLPIFTQTGPNLNLRHPLLLAIAQRLQILLDGGYELV